MKVLIFTLFLLVFLKNIYSQEWGSSAQTNPIGLTNIDVTESAEDNIPSYTFLSSGYNNESAYSGMIDSISGSTISFSDFIIETDANSYEDNALTQSPHLLVLRDGNPLYNGRSFLVIGHEGNDVTINLKPDEVSTYFSATDSIDIIEANTLSSLFGSGEDFLGKKGTPSNADNILVWSTYGWKTYFYNDDKWQTFGTRTDQSNAIIYPDEGVIYVRKSIEPLILTFNGNAPTVAQVYMPQAGNKFLMANPFPTNMKISELVDSSTNWEKSQVFSECDYVLYWSGNSWITYYHNVNNWINSVSGEVDDREILPGESILIVKNKVSSGGSFQKVEL